MERAFKLTKFRNFGLNKPERLVINHTFEKGKMGELIILIGPNNSGKSNVLDALFKFNSGKLTDRDVTTLEYDDEFLHPEVSFTAKDDDANVYGKKVILNGSETFMDEKVKSKAMASFTQDEAEELADILRDCLDEHETTLKNYGSSKFCENLTLYIDELLNAKTSNEIQLAVSKIYFSDFMVAYRKNNIFFSYSQVRTIVSEMCEEITSTQAYEKITKREDLSKATPESAFQNKHNLRLVPNVIRYQEVAITEENLTCSPDRIRSNSFFSSLFTEKEIAKIDNVYASLKKHRNIALLKELSKSFEDKVETINKRFNRMYFAEKDKYYFSLVFESGQIYFAIERGNKSVFLNYQSTGFRWFFYFYFNFLSLNKFIPGDIVIMDEPATNLHPQGQVELRRFIKELARRIDITFVIATHSPFLIDVDNFDELRVVSTKDNEAHIDNLFTAINTNDPDTLLPIKESLTIRQHILYDYNTTVIFVEGITDYNYLTLFKKIFEKENIAFVPIQGIGNNNEMQERIINKLIKINKNPIVLVDSDKAGKSAVAKAKDKNIEIHSIDEFIPGAKEIEDIFSKQDQIKFKVKEKDAFYSSLIKNTTGEEDFTKETLDNFKKVLDNLEN